MLQLSPRVVHNVGSTGMLLEYGEQASSLHHASSSGSARLLRGGGGSSGGLEQGGSGIYAWQQQQLTALVPKGVTAVGPAAGGKPEPKPDSLRPSGSRGDLLSPFSDLNNHEGEGRAVRACLPCCRRRCSCCWHGCGLASQLVPPMLPRVGTPS